MKNACDMLKSNLSRSDGAYSRSVGLEKQSIITCYINSVKENIYTILTDAKK